MRLTTSLAFGSMALGAERALVLGASFLPICPSSPLCFSAISPVWSSFWRLSPGSFSAGLGASGGLMMNLAIRDGFLNRSSAVTSVS